MRLILTLLILLPSVAYAQQQQPNPNREAVVLAYRQLGLALNHVLSEPAVDPGEIAKLQARIVELEKLCGAPCKPKAAEPK